MCCLPCQERHIQVSTLDFHHPKQVVPEIVGPLVASLEGFKQKQDHLFGREHRERLFSPNEGNLSCPLKDLLPYGKHRRKGDYDFEQRLQMHKRKAALMQNGCFYLLFMKQVQTTQLSAERGEMLLAETGNEVDLQRCPLQTVERTREQARKRVGNIQVFTYLCQWTDRSQVIGGISDLYAIRVQSPAEFISQVFAVLALEEQESHLLIIGMWMQLPDILIARF